MAIPRNTVNVSNNKINVVEVISFGPRGPQGSGGGNINEALTTASLAGYNLTFTKGDRTQFTLSLPQPTPTPTGQFIISASNLRSENVIDFTRQNEESFFVRVDNVENATSSSISVTANTASYVLASNIDTSVAIPTLNVTNLTATNFDLDNNLTITGSLTAASLTAASLTAATISGAIDYSYIENVPYFVDAVGDIAPNQLAIFIDSTTGLPESLPFNLPLGADGGNPTVKGLAGLTFDGTTFNVQGNISASGDIIGGNFDIDILSVTSLTIDQLTGSIDYSHLKNVPQFVDTQNDISANQIAIFADNTTGLPESLPFNLPLGSDGNPTIQGLSGLTFDGTTFDVQGNINSSGSITAGDFNITTLSRDLAISANLTTNVFKANNFAEITGGLFLSSSLTAANLAYKIPQTSDDVLVYETGGGIKHVGQRNLPYTRFTSSATPSDAQLLMMTSSGGPITREVTNSPITYSPIFGLNISGIGTSFDIVANKIFIGEVTASSSTHTSLNVTGNEIDFTNLPTSDPGVSGRLFRTGSDAIGGSAGFQVVIVSQG